MFTVCLQRSVASTEPVQGVWQTVPDVSKLDYEVRQKNFDELLKFDRPYPAAPIDEPADLVIILFAINLGPSLVDNPAKTVDKRDKKVEKLGMCGMD